MNIATKGSKYSISNIQYLLILIFLAVGFLLFASPSKAATEFISIIDPDNAAGTDYTSLSAWENAIQADLTATSTLVFSCFTAYQDYYNYFKIKV